MSIRAIDSDIYYLVVDASVQPFPLTVDDGKLMADADTGEFWGFFGGFAPLPKKTTNDEPKSTDAAPSKLFRYISSSISTASSVPFYLTLIAWFDPLLCFLAQRTKLNMTSLY